MNKTTALLTATTTLALTLTGCRNKPEPVEPVPPAPVYEDGSDYNFAPIEPLAPAGGNTQAGGGYVPEPTPVPSSSRTHTLRDGDTLWGLAEQYYNDGTRYEDIIAANPGINPQRLQIGEEIIIP